MRKSLCILLNLLLCPMANSTGQIRDELKIEETIFSIEQQPLTQIIKQEKVTKVVSDDDARKYDVIEICTASYRGFKVIWRLHKNELYIDSIIKNPCSYDDIELEAKLIFPESKNYPIKATWFNGDISTSVSEEKDSVDNSTLKPLYKTTYDALVYTFINGKLISRKIVNKIKY